MRVALRDSCISLKSGGRCYSRMLTLVVRFKLLEDLFTSRDLSLFAQRWSRAAAQCERMIGITQFYLCVQLVKTSLGNFEVKRL